MSINRIEACLDKLKERQEKAFITYLTAGLPDMEKTKELVKAQERAGCDIIELGIPFSDPIADGPVIQQASYEAIQNGATLKKIFACLEELHAEGVQVPIVFMMYYNTIVHYGVQAFADKCKEAGVDGLIVPDLPFEEQDELMQALSDSDKTILLQLVSPVSAQRIPMILEHARGFVLLCFPDGRYRSGCRLPQQGRRISCFGEGTVEDPGHDGIWNPHRSGCCPGKGAYRRSNRWDTLYRAFA